MTSFCDRPQPSSVPPRQESLTRPRLDFTRARRRFSSTIRRFCAADLGRFRRRSFSRACCSACVRDLRCSSSRSQSCSHARSRFADWDRSAWQRTSVPVGKCRSTTVDEVLLIFCPPGPRPRVNCSSTSATDTPKAARRCSIWVGKTIRGTFFSAKLCWCKRVPPFLPDTAV